MTVNIYGGGARTNINGLKFEQVTSLSQALINAGYVVSNSGIVFSKNSEIPIALIAPKHKLYNLLLKPRGIDWSELISNQLLPDEALYNYLTNTVYIIEKKFQNSSGSVDEKLQTCEYKKIQYTKLFEPLNIKVEYIYVCNDWFLKDKYRDVRDYIISKECHIYINEIPLQTIGL